MITITFYFENKAMNIIAKQRKQTVRKSQDHESWSPIGYINIKVWKCSTMQ